MIARLLRTEPAIVRGLLIAITAIAAAILGREVSTEWVDTVLVIYTYAAPFVAGILIRRAVTPVRSSGPTSGGTFTTNITTNLTPEQASQAIERVMRRTQQRGLYPREGA